MPFTSGSATGWDDFVQQLCAYAVSNAGFTANSTVLTSDARPVRSIAKNGVSYAFYRGVGQLSAGSGTNRAGAVGLVCLMGYGNPLAGFNPTTDGTSGTMVFPIGTRRQVIVDYGYTGPFPNFWIYTNGTVVHACIEMTTGVFAHLSFGRLSMRQGYSFGDYLTASCGTVHPSSTSTSGDVIYSTDYSTIFNGEWDNGNYATTGWWVRLGNSGAASDFQSVNDSFQSSFPEQYGGTFMSRFYEGPMACCSNAAWGRVPMYPAGLMAKDSAGDGYTNHIAGMAPGVCITLMRPSMVAGDIVHTDWQIFPLLYRSDVRGNGVAPPSFDWAIAYKRFP